MEGYRVVQGQLQRVQAEEAFPFLKEAGHVVSLVGGGGKTTLLYFLAEAYRRRGLRAAVLTTTHIYDPALPVGRPGIVDFGGEHVSGIAQIQACWAREGYPVLGVRTVQKAERQRVFTEKEPGRRKQELLAEREQAEGQQKPLAETWQEKRAGRSWEKLGPPAEEELAFVLAHADAVLIEADGARKMPCKLPATHEPVILPESDWVVGVAGLSALGKPVREVCFRAEEIAQKSCTAEQSQDLILEHCMSEQDLARLLASRCGARKGVGERKYLAVLNQCDGAAVMQQGDQILRLLASYGIDAVMTGFAERKRAGVCHNIEAGM